MDVSHKATAHFSTSEHQSVGILYFLFGSAGVLTNGFLACTFLREPALPSAKKVLHINLAIANMLVCAGFPFSGMSSFRGRWLFGSAGCQAYGVESFGGGISAVLFVMVLCIERYVACMNRDFYNTVSSGMLWFVAALCWFYGFAWGLFPIFGWSSYAVESSGTACGIDWIQKDGNHTSYLIILSLSSMLLMAVAILCVTKSKSFWSMNHIKQAENEWFTEKQLLWICIAFLSFVAIGWGPYTYFAMWSAYSDNKNISMLAVTLPPLFAKGTTSLYSLPYLLASDRFRAAYSGVPEGRKLQKLN